LFDDGLALLHLRDIADLQDQLADRGQKIEPVPADIEVIGHDHDIVKEPVDRLFQIEQHLQGAKVVTTGKPRLNPLPYLQISSMQFLLRPGLEDRWIDRVLALSFRMLRIRL